MEWKLGRSNKIKRLALDTHTYTSLHHLEEKLHHGRKVESDSHVELG